MAEGSLDVRRSQVLEGRDHQPWVRRGGLTLMLALLGLALANVFGQRSVTTTARAAAATLSVSSPDRLRGGLLFTSRFTVLAHRAITKPTLVLDPGWFQQMTLNSIGPNPMNQSSRNGRVVFTFDKLAAGQRLVVWISWQVNPTNVTHRSENVELDNGTSPLATVRRSVAVFP
jgi:hypothetical protein